MRRDIRAYVEAELRDYHETLKELALLREDILHQTPTPSEGRSNQPGRPTEQKAIKLIADTRLRYMERTVRAIQAVLSELEETQYGFVQLRYWTRPRVLTDIGVAQKLCMSKATLYRWKDTILQAIAVEMGVIDMPQIKYSVKFFEKDEKKMRLLRG